MNECRKRNEDFERTKKCLLTLNSTRTKHALFFINNHHYPKQNTRSQCQEKLLVVFSGWLENLLENLDFSMKTGEQNPRTSFYNISSLSQMLTQAQHSIANSGKYPFALASDQNNLFHIKARTNQDQFKSKSVECRNLIVYRKSN